MQWSGERENRRLQINQQTEDDTSGKFFTGLEDLEAGRIACM